MAGRKRKVAERDYAGLIKSSEEKIAKLTEELKVERINLKNLKKDYAKYEAQKAEEQKQQELKEVTKMILESGKPISEIKEMFAK